MTEEQYMAILSCIIHAENANSKYLLDQADIAREWFDTQDWQG